MPYLMLQINCGHRTTQPPTTSKPAPSRITHFAPCRYHIGIVIRRSILTCGYRYVSFPTPAVRGLTGATTTHKFEEVTTLDVSNARNLLCRRILNNLQVTITGLMADLESRMLPQMLRLLLESRPFEC